MSLRMIFRMMNIEYGFEDGFEDECFPLNPNTLILRSPWSDPFCHPYSNREFRIPEDSQDSKGELFRARV
jgi:hypothetical protein